MIQVEHLTKRYGDRKAIDDLTFSAEKGHIYGFLGPNGAGKSTTMNIMTGYLSATSGTVKINNFDITRQPEEAKKNIGYLPEIPPVYTDMTVREYLSFAADLKGVARKNNAGAVEHALKCTGTSGVSERLIKNLSKGYRQRVGLAQAIINDPEVIVLDEPTVGLDPEQQREMFDYIRTLRDDHIVIISSHILSDISAVCDYIWILNKGHLIASDTPENIREGSQHKQEVRIVVLADSEQKLGDVLRLVQNVVSVDISVVEDPGNGAPKQIQAVIRSDSELDIRPAISQAVSSAGMFFLEMNRTKKSLEDAFLALTDSDDEKIHAEKQRAAEKVQHKFRKAKADREKAAAEDTIVSASDSQAAASDAAHTANAANTDSAAAAGEAGTAGSADTDSDTATDDHAQKEEQ